jgi:hypothetical protein
MKNLTSNKAKIERHIPTVIEVETKYEFLMKMYNKAKNNR